MGLSKRGTYEKGPKQHQRHDRTATDVCDAAKQAVSILPRQVGLVCSACTMLQCTAFQWLANHLLPDDKQSYAMHDNLGCIMRCRSLQAMNEQSAKLSDYCC